METGVWPYFEIQRSASCLFAGIFNHHPFAALGSEKLHLKQLSGRDVTKPAFTFDNPLYQFRGQRSVLSHSFFVYRKYGIIATGAPQRRGEAPGASGYFE
jgi:hypothetical protein